MLIQELKKLVQSMPITWSDFSPKFNRGFDGSIYSIDNSDLIQ